jgi:FlaA1/EpsC-like NDP-sugar epimerase
VKPEVGFFALAPGLARSAWDSFSWILAMQVAVLLRYDGDVPAGVPLNALVLSLGAALGQLTLSLILQRLRGRFLLGSFDEIFGVSLVTFLVTVGTFLFALVISPAFVPRSVPLIAGTLALGLMLAARFAVRSIRQHRRTPKSGARVIILGAGESGEQIARQMIASPDSGYIPVAFLDDDPTKSNLRVQGVRVYGTSNDLEHVARDFSAEILVVAVGAISSKQLRSLDSRCSQAGLRLRVIPTTSEIMSGSVRLGDITDVTEEELLGRRPVQTDESAIQRFLQGKRVLVTGAGGSIGSELARQVNRYEPGALFLLDRDESALHSLQLSLDGRGLLDDPNLILADIRDAERLIEIFDSTRPEIVFHAAALKHLTLLERYPQEAQKTNVDGTRNVLQAAETVGTPVFINISTDKAADPKSVLGRTKLQTEVLTAKAFPSENLVERRYMSVRFGNVIGSRGSVLTTFRHQVARGGPLTVTDPAVTRFFMTVPEAVHLVLQAAVLGEHGETLILDMGDPVRIADVAQHLIERSGQAIDIVYTGLRPGEKLTEALIAPTEEYEIRKHPLILHVRSTTPGE